MAATNLGHRTDAVRQFNRFYTKQIGVLTAGYLRSPFSLTEVRVLYEIAHRDHPTASTLSEELGVDAGYLSRILRIFKKRGLINKEPSVADGRQHFLLLTEHGQKTFAALDGRARDQIGSMLRKLSPEDQVRVVEAMRTIENLLGAPPESTATFLLRPHEPGDMGWVVHRHGVLYAQEYGWDEQFEALVAGIVAKFIQHYDPKRERCWIAEKDGEIVGSVFLVKRSATVAQLRLMLVEPKARGLGLGTRFVSECVRFARHSGYQKITLWTNSVLRAARHIYQSGGFKLVHSEPHHSFGHDLVGETWELKL